LRGATGERLGVWLLVSGAAHALALGTVGGFSPAGGLPGEGSARVSVTLAGAATQASAVAPDAARARAPERPPEAPRAPASGQTPVRQVPPSPARAEAAATPEPQAHAPAQLAAVPAPAERTAAPPRPAAPARAPEAETSRAAAGAPSSAEPAPPSPEPPAAAGREAAGRDDPAPEAPAGRREPRTPPPPAPRAIQAGGAEVPAPGSVVASAPAGGGPGAAARAGDAGTEGGLVSSEALLALLHRAIDRHKRYPGIARRQGREGTATVSFSLHPDGRVGNVDVARSSGFHPLDRAAVQAVGQVAPFAPAEQYLSDVARFEVNVVFSLYR